MQFLQHFWPKRLYTQIMLAAAAALLVAQIINAILLINAMGERAVNDASTMLLNSDAVGAELAGDDRQIRRQERRAARREARGQRGGSDNDENQRKGPRNVDIMRSDTQSIIPSFVIDTQLSQRAATILGDMGPDGPFIMTGNINDLPVALRGRAFRYQMNRQLQRGNYRMATRAMLLSVRNENGQWIMASRIIRPVSNRAIWGLILQTLLIYAILLSVLAIITRRISKPLDQLKNGLVMVGQSGGIPIKPNGPNDVRELIENYNDMNKRISSLLSEKDVMLGAIGHDLKTPLASLRVRVESIDDDGERQQMIGSIDDMNIMLGDILTLSRLGKSSEPMIKTDIAALIETVMDDFSQDMERIAFSPPTKSITANIRPALMRRALRNIIGNALRYGGNAIIDAALDHHILTIIISDDGPGIDPVGIDPVGIDPVGIDPRGVDQDAFNRVFEPFERLESSRNKASGGSGLGLTISRAIIRAHGGDISLSNRKSGGLQVMITLPA